MIDLQKLIDDMDAKFDEINGSDKTYKNGIERAEIRGASIMLNCFCKGVTDMILRSTKKEIEI